MIPKGFVGDRKAPGNLSKINQWERNIVVYYKNRVNVCRARGVSYERQRAKPANG